MKRLIGLLALTPNDNCKCEEFARLMDAWGIEGCREHRAEILDHLRKAYAETSWRECVAAGGRAVTSGLAFKVNPLRPVESLLEWLVDEAIRRAEAT